ncbi:hypothetical protein E2P81_ATG07213 [Venturia nashicola]|nr:hypothetical protein E2P81_ATG07213 [Venturia nashicola]
MYSFVFLAIVALPAAFALPVPEDCPLNLKSHSRREALQAETKSYLGKIGYPNPTFELGAAIGATVSVVNSASNVVDLDTAAAAPVTLVGGIVKAVPK